MVIFNTTTEFCRQVGRDDSKLHNIKRIFQLFFALTVNRKYSVKAEDMVSYLTMYMHDYLDGFLMIPFAGTGFQ